MPAGAERCHRIAGDEDTTNYNPMFAVTRAANPSPFRMVLTRIAAGGRLSPFSISGTIR